MLLLSTLSSYFNPTTPNCTNKSRLDKISILEQEGITEKNSYVPSVYESVDNRNLSYVVTRKLVGKEFGH